MSKSNALFSLSTDILLKFRERVKERDRSKTVETLLFNFLESNPDDRDELKLIHEIDEISEERDKLSIRLGTKKTLLERLKIEKERQLSREEAERLQNKVLLNDNIRINRGLDEL